MKQTIIPAGYRLTVHTWENDADNRQSATVEGLTRYQLDFLLDGAKLFKRCYYEGGIGNIYDPSVGEFQKVQDAFVALHAKHKHMLHDAKYGCYFEPLREDQKQYYDSEAEHIVDSFGELFYDLTLTSGEFYTRVLDSFKVEYVPQEIVLQDVTEEFQ